MVRAYVDTSLLTAYYCPEPGSRKAEATLRSLQRAVISSLTEVELVSAVARKVRERALARADARRIVQVFARHVRAGYFEMMAVEGSDFRRARELLGRFDNPLRTLDALHVALAERASLPLTTADRALADSARRLAVAFHYVDYARP